MYVALGRQVKYIDNFIYKTKKIFLFVNNIYKKLIISLIQKTPEFPGSI
jgi:hypothetical protein